MGALILRLFRRHGAAEIVALDRNRSEVVGAMLLRPDSKGTHIGDLVEERAAGAVHRLLVDTFVRRSWQGQDQGEARVLNLVMKSR